MVNSTITVLLLYISLNIILYLIVRTAWFQNLNDIGDFISFRTFSFNTKYESNWNTKDHHMPRVKNSSTEIYRKRGIRSSLINTTTNFTSNPLGTERKKWMQSLYEHNLMTDEIKINDIVFPGSHNSAAFKMANRMCFDRLLDLLENLRKEGFPKFDFNIARKTAQNQNIGIYEQLQNGIRFLDIKFIANPDFTNIVYPLHHTFLVDDEVNSIYKVFDIIADFLKENYMETIIVHLSTYAGCAAEGVNYRSDLENYMSTFGDMFMTPKSIHLESPIEGFKGKALVDFTNWSDSIGINHWPGRGFGLELKDNCYYGNPLQYGSYYEFNQGESHHFTIFDFFPNGDQKSFIWSALRPFHGGLKDWNRPYDDNMWVMHSIISQVGINVNAIMADFIDTKPLYEVATQLTLYRIFTKKGGLWKNVTTSEEVISSNERFEHHCPPGWIITGIQIGHNSSMEDQRWRFNCELVNWVEMKSLYSNSSNSFHEGHFHPSSWNGETNLANDFNGLIEWSFPNGSYALTGIGGLYDSDKNDRRFWFYVSQVESKDNSCEWWMSSNLATKLKLLSNEWISGIRSTYDQNKRSWNFFVCR